MPRRDVEEPGHWDEPQCPCPPRKYSKSPSSVRLPLRGSEDKDNDGEGKGREGKGREGRKREGGTAPLPYFLPFPSLEGNSFPFPFSFPLLSQPPGRSKFAADNERGVHFRLRVSTRRTLHTMSTGGVVLSPLAASQHAWLQPTASCSTGAPRSPGAATAARASVQSERSGLSFSCRRRVVAGPPSPPPFAAAHAAKSASWSASLNEV